MVIKKPMLAKIESFNRNDNTSLYIPYHLHFYVMKMITTPYTFLTLIRFYQTFVLMSITFYIFLQLNLLLISKSLYIFLLLLLGLSKIQFFYFHLLKVLLDAMLAYTIFLFVLSTYLYKQ